jgi:hypothetical protein
MMQDEKELFAEIESAAFSAPSPNTFTPRIIQAVRGLRRLFQQRSDGQDLISVSEQTEPPIRIKSAGQVEEIYAFLATNPDTGEEGIIGGMIGPVWQPLLTFNKVHALEIRRTAIDIAKKIGWECKLVKFTTREEIEQLTSPGKLHA